MQSCIHQPSQPSGPIFRFSPGLCCASGLSRSATRRNTPLLNQDLVERRGWLRSSDVTEALAYTKPLPGSTVVQVVTFLGWRMAGWPGAIVATLTFLLPGFVVMTVAAAAVFALPDAPIVRRALAGLQVAVVGLLAGAMWRLVRSEVRSVPLMIVLAAAFVLGLFVNAAVVVVFAGVIGVAIHRIERHA
jgi:chromate transporter